MLRKAENGRVGGDPAQGRRGQGGRFRGAGDGAVPAWTFLSHHAHVLCCLARQPGIRLREVAEQLEITERSVFRILADLERAGIVQRRRVGRRNAYRLRLNQRLPHPLEARCTVRDLVVLLAEKGQAR